MSNKKGIEKHCEYLESKIRKKQYKIDSLHQEIQQLKEQLKQRDEVIEKAIDFCNYLIENNEVEIDNEKYFKQSCDDIITNAILEKLQKYKGDNK